MANEALLSEQRDEKYSAANRHASNASHIQTRLAEDKAGQHATWSLAAVKWPLRAQLPALRQFRWLG